MKVTFDFENGMQLTLKPENCSLIDNPGKGTAVVTKMEGGGILPLMFFQNVVLASVDELKARQQVLIAKAEAEKIAADKAKQAEVQKAAAELAAKNAAGAPAAS